MNRRWQPCSLSSARSTVWIGCAALALLVGCGRSDVAHFRIDLTAFDPADYSASGDAPAQKKAKGVLDAATALEAMFGTPDEPYVFDEIAVSPQRPYGLDLEKLRRAAGPVATRPDGVHVGLYRQHCVHCHGITGDGQGPTALFLTPYPRDYRLGKYKFKMTQQAAKPATADLARVLHDGIPGTAMPSFALLPATERDALVEYVKYLTIRGETEAKLLRTVFGDEEDIELSHDALATELAAIAGTWFASDAAHAKWQAEIAKVERGESGDFEAVKDLIIVPGPSGKLDMQASIARGRMIFMNQITDNGKPDGKPIKQGLCFTCHGPTGMGDGRAKPFYDDWNKPENKSDAAIARGALPRQEQKPRNLRDNIYRFGRTPADLYRRIHAGIAGTEMPGGGITPQKPDGLTSEDIWDVVHYIQSLPYELHESPAPSGHPTHVARTGGL